MNSLIVGSIVFICAFGGALLGMFLRLVLPDHHLSAESKDAVKVGVGLITTMAAPVLGLLVATAKASFDSKSSELTEISADTVMLDRMLAHYGPETRTIREQLRRAGAHSLEMLWPQNGQAPQLEPAGGAEVLYDAIDVLSPKNEAQRAIQSQALRLTIDIGKTRWLLFEQSGSSISTPFLIVLVFWLTGYFYEHRSVCAA